MNRPPDTPKSRAALYDPAGDGWTTEPEGGFLGLVGPIWKKTADGRRRFGFMAEDRHANLIGVVQGGMLMTFADRGMGTMAHEAAGRSLVTIDFAMQFVGAGRIGTFIELQAEVVRKTAELVFMRGLVTGGGRTLANCHGTWKVLSDRSRRAAGSGQGEPSR